MSKYVNHCPNCNAVTYGNNGCTYANRFNSTKFCMICGSAMNEVYTDDEFINLWKERHERWIKERYGNEC